MKILILLLLASCSHAEFNPLHTTLVSYRYKCPDNYLILKDANNRLYCVLNETSRVDQKTKKKPKFRAKIDCNRVFKEINQCMK